MNLSNCVLRKYLNIFRYDFERLCNNLKRVERLLDLDAPIKEAYFPKLDRLVTNRSYPARVANQKLQNLRREGLGEGAPVDVADLKRWTDTILGAINSGVVKDVSMLVIESVPYNLLSFPKFRERKVLAGKTFSVSAVEKHLVGFKINQRFALRFIFFSI